jgi:hypothetical protein
MLGWSLQPQAVHGSLFRRLGWDGRMMVMEVEQARWPSPDGQFLHRLSRKSGSTFRRMPCHQFASTMPSEYMDTG